ncbi:MAG: histidine kinase [Thaumarchaeota archaeon]|nr:histidine kinase [Nitrososphaerota archaeon]MDE1841134.1 histidine kinase [Nitrososphaerota archaeon]MDE1878049.1 histidine kinase [Nitrososphaerota archaeon]
MIDTIDEVILSSLSKNAKNDTREILENLMDSGHNLTESEIESRIAKLEDSGVITGYTISVDLKKIPRRTIRVSLVTFRTSQHLPKRLEGLKKYLADAPFVIFSGKTRGGYDWITIQSFFNEEMADDESDIYRNLFGDIIQSYEIYDFVPMKELSHQALTHTKREYKKFLDEWIPPFLGK